MSRKKLLTEFVQEAGKREFAALPKYGVFDPKKDKRILSVEAQEENIDILNYMRFLHRKHPSLREDINKVKRLAFDLYVLLRNLEARELELTRKKGGAL